MMYKRNGKPGQADENSAADAGLEERHNITDPDVELFVSMLAKSDEEILNTFSFTLDGIVLDRDEACRFIAYIRSWVGNKKTVV
ncbi:hypothetical protein [Paenibacillus hamazuiensis]|uniref:hypothetical protein n=1 Tax=Paenibacillus hamazuiensis TaxID=2936508 RepID=UPI00200CBA74|nr:hypothetical protein [Paenibacillus hamazuiensis]